jgi:hypothetical protein
MAAVAGWGAAVVCCSCAAQIVTQSPPVWVRLTRHTAATAGRTLFHVMHHQHAPADPPIMAVQVLLPMQHPLHAAQPSSSSEGLRLSVMLNIPCLPRSISSLDSNMGLVAAFPSGLQQPWQPRGAAEGGLLSKHTHAAASHPLLHPSAPTECLGSMCTGLFTRHLACSAEPGAVVSCISS